MNDIATPDQIALWVTTSAFVLGFIFALVASHTNFCTMGAVADWYNMGDSGRMRMWVMTMAVAILGANGMHALGWIDLGKTIYVSRQFTWLAYVVGGGCFGFGMTLASGCGVKTLMRMGSGNLKSAIVFMVMGMTAYMTLRGLFASLRVHVIEPVVIQLPVTQDLPAVLAYLTDRAVILSRLNVAMIVAAVLVSWAVTHRDFRREPMYAVGACVLGSLVAAAWYVTGHLGYLAEHPDTLQEAFIATNSGRMEGLSFVAPMAWTLEYLMLWTDKSRVITFGIASAAGIVLGATVYARFSGKFRWEGFRDASDTAHHLIGAALMGFGGVTALGCTVGQGLSGISTLALGSIVTTAAIIIGSIAALRYQNWQWTR
jgi:uncharacterized membrane protein YedE/YeeE